MRLGGMMGFLDSLKSKAQNAMDRPDDGTDEEEQEYPTIRHRDASNDSQQNGPDYDDDLIDDKDYANDEVQSMRPDMLKALNIPSNYEPGPDILLPEDLDDVQLSYEEPRGYNVDEVNRLFDMFSKTLNWCIDHLNMRNADVARMANMLDKTATDMHNMKIDEELSEGLQVVTGQPSQTENDLRNAQMRILQLQGELDDLRKETGQKHTLGPGDDRYDELQNQLSILRQENQKLTTQVKRLKLGKMSENEEDFQLDDSSLKDRTNDSSALPMPGEGPVNDEDDSGLPMPDDDALPIPDEDGLPNPDDDGLPAPEEDDSELPMPDEEALTDSDDDDISLPMPVISNETDEPYGRKSLEDAASDEENTSLDVSIHHDRKTKPKHRKLESDPDYHRKEPPLPDDMNDDQFQDIGYPDDGDEDEIDMTDFMTDE